MCIYLHMWQVHTVRANKLEMGVVWQFKRHGSRDQPLTCKSESKSVSLYMKIPPPDPHTIFYSTKGPSGA